LAQASTRPTLRWTFIVLDTDGVNAFAAPGGYVHITRGALALIKNEGELADVLAHEISHVTKEHTLTAIKNSKLEGTLASALTRDEFLKALGGKLYEMALENPYDRKQEMDATRRASPLPTASVIRRPALGNSSRASPSATPG
jgi:predicted Zn-dependent protease